MFQFKIAGKEVFSIGRSAVQGNLTHADIIKIFGGGPTQSGIEISEEKALGISAVYSAVRVIGESVASLPFQLFKKTDKGREVQYKHPVYKLIHDEPNNYQN